MAGNLDVFAHRHDCGGGMTPESQALMYTRLHNRVGSVRGHNYSGRGRMDNDPNLIEALPFLIHRVGLHGTNLRRIGLCRTDLHGSLSWPNVWGQWAHKERRASGVTNAQGLLEFAVPRPYRTSYLQQSPLRNSHDRIPNTRRQHARNFHHSKCRNAPRLDAS